MFKDDTGQSLNRRDLVLGLPHKGGRRSCHPELERAYAALARGNSLGMQFPDHATGVWVPADSPVPANVRQIAWELK